MASQTPGRKQWRIFREPIENIQSLGLAEDGCPDSQVILAKHLLEENLDESGDHEEKARQGVYWLIKASEKGHEEATRILQNCLRTGRGISERNISDVRACLKMPQGEKVSRKAARDLFSRLSQGEDFVTCSQLIEEMRKCSQDCPRSEADWRWEAEEAPGGGDRLTEEMVVGAASHLYRGELPVALRASYRDWTTASLALLSPPPHHLHLHLHTLTLLIMATVSILGLEALLEALPHLIYYLTLSIMMVTTCRVLIKKWEFDQFKRWSNMLVAWGCPESHSQEAQWAHCLHNSLPSLVFLLALSVNIFFSSFIPNIPHSELVVFSTIMSLFMLFNFAWNKRKADFLLIGSFVVHLLARYPYEIDTVVSQYWRYLDVHTPTLTSYVVGKSIEFCLNFSSIFYIILPVLLVKIASRERWLGIFTSLLPHIISLSWWQMAVLSSNGATWYGVIRACLAVVGLVLFVPLTGLALLLIPSATVIKFFMYQRISTPVALAAASGITTLYLGSKLKRGGKFFKLIKLGLAVPCLWLLVSSTTESLQEGGGSLSEPGLSWEEYRSVCQSGGEERCSQLGGLQVTWEGRLLSHRLLNIYNPMELIVTKLPLKMQNTVRCMYGDKFSDCLEKGEKNCDIPSSLQNKCHLSNWNRYEYELEVLLSSEETGGWSSGGAVRPQTGLLISSPTLANFTRHLHSGDRLWFSGLLAAPPPSTLLTSTPRLSLLQIGCLSCAQMSPTTVAPLPFSFDFGPSLRAIFNFIFSPLAEMK